MTKGYALLIGANDYTAYDASLHQPQGSSDLKGSLNDVRSWLRLCRDLGYPPENIRVLTTPALPEAERQGAQHGPATAEAIREGVKWLAEALGSHREAGGVMTFSGHGDQTQEGLVLCPSSTTADGDKLQHVVHLLEVQQIIAEHQAGKNLTVVLDCCHSGNSDAGGMKQPLTLRKQDTSKVFQRSEIPSIGDRMYFAAEIGECAYQAKFQGRVHGAFTWAFMTTRDQWTIVGRNGHKQLDISYADMLHRTHALLASLSFGQEPSLRIPPSSAALPLFHVGPDKVGDETSRAPTAERTRIQCDPGTKDYRVYTLTQYINRVWTTMGYILVPATSHDSYEVGTEYWYMISNLVAAGEDLKFSWEDYDWSTTPSLGPLSFTIPQAASWEGTSSAPEPGSMMFVNNGPGEFCLNWQMTLSDSDWGGHMTWWTPTGQNTLFGGMQYNFVYTQATIGPYITWYAGNSYPSYPS